MTSIVLSILSGLIGIAVTIVAHKLNPRQKIWNMLDQLSREKIKLERQRDEALEQNNSDMLTAAGNELLRVRNEEANLLQRLRQINSSK